MRATYLERDAARGRDATFRWLTEEVGELAKAMRTGDRENLQHEFGDVLAWLLSLANVEGVELEDAIARYVDWLSAMRDVPVRVPCRMNARIVEPSEAHREQIAGVLSASINFPLERALLNAPLLKLDDIRVALEDDRVVATAGEFRFDQWFGGRGARLLRDHPGRHVARASSGRPRHRVHRRAAPTGA